jgi:hypothetical protein
VIEGANMSGSVAPVSRAVRIVPAIALALGLAAGANSLAGELTLAWEPSRDALTAGYEVEVLDAADRVLEAIDAGAETTIVVSGLDDGRSYRFRVRPYDRFGHKARRASTALETMPEPVVAAVSVATREDGTLDLFVEGANFQQGARLVTRQAGLSVRELTVGSHASIHAVVSHEGQAPAISVADVLVVNPVRKAPRYLLAHPELFDVDDSGTIDQADLDAIDDAFGLTLGAPGYLAALDPNGDGVIDGEDRSQASSALRRERRTPGR